MAREIDIKKGLDWTTVWIYIILILIGLANIYAAVYSVDNPKPIYSLDHNAGKQIMFMFFSFILIMIILFVDYKIYDSFAYIFYGIWIGVLILTIFIAPDIKGSRSWIRFGSIGLQPAELSKTITLLALAKYLSTQGVNIAKFDNLFKAGLLILLPPIIIIMQKETGSALAYAAFLIILYREGLPGAYPALFLGFIALFVLGLIFENQLWIVILGLALFAVLFWYLFLKRYDRNRQNLQRTVGLFVLFTVYVLSVDFAFNNILASHQQNRIRVLVDKDVDPLGAGWNIAQSKIAIGTGGLFGKGYLQGTQTKFDFVPEQSTDFIFCTVGEEWGFVGVFFVIALYLILITRIYNLAEKQKFKFARIYGYGVASIIFFHLLVNIGMTVGLIPIIGIPLPFLSYGGSGLLSFIYISEIRCPQEL
jgi:rod shape determining protein RodA